MKNILLLFFMLTTFSVFAQEKAELIDKARVQTKKIQLNPNARQFDGTESLEGRPIRKTIHQIHAEQGAQTNSNNKEEWIGITYYDLQTNGVGQNRISGEDTLNIRTVWTHHGQTEDGNFPNRGTGFNETDTTNGRFLDHDNLKLEMPRTGWPNLVKLPDGTDVVVCHEPVDPGEANNLIMLRRAPGSAEWVESTIPTEVPFGLLWPQIAVGQSGTLHMVCVSTPEANDGAIYLGLNPAMLYFRSLDGGLNWDISDQILPGLVAPDPATTDDLNSGIRGDTYKLVTDDKGNVAIGIFDLLEDIRLMKSTDNGDTWVNNIVSALPFDDYSIGTVPYTVEDLGGIDPLGPGAGSEDLTTPQALAFLTSDGSGSVALDPNGDAHIVFPQNYFSAADTSAQGGVSSFPFFGGLMYWSECADSLSRIPGVFNALDTNEDGVINYLEGGDFGVIPNYNGGMFISMPSLEILADGRLVLAYTAMMEEFPREDNEDGQLNPIQYFSHVWMTGSPDNGATWTTPVDIINAELALFGSILINTTDAVFPNTQVISENQVAVTYQFDDEPGLNLFDAARDTPLEGDPIAANTISMITINVEEILGLTENPEELCGLTSTTVVTPETFKFKVSPNPATGFTTINFELDQRENVTIDLYNVVGSLVSQDKLGNIAIGTHNQNMVLDNLAPGIYIVSLRAGDKIATQKLVLTK